MSGELRVCITETSNCLVCVMLCNGCMQDLVCVRRPFYHEAASRDGFPGNLFLRKGCEQSQESAGKSHIPAALVSQPF